MKLAAQRGFAIFFGIVAALSITLCAYLVMGGVAFRAAGNNVDSNLPMHMYQRYYNENNNNNSGNINNNGTDNNGNNSNTDTNGNDGNTDNNGNNNGTTNNGNTDTNGNNNGNTDNNGTTNNGNTDNNQNGDTGGLPTDTQYKLQLENLYKEVMYSLSDGMNNLQSSLEKVSIANNAASIHRYLLECERYSSACAADLTLLPVDYSSEAVQGALRFTNQVADYCVCLAKEIKGGKSLKENARARLEEFSGIAKSFEDNLRTAAKEGDFSFSFLGDEGGTSSQEFSSLFEYPALIYDGPFSDAQKGEIKAGKNITMEEGKNKILNALSSYGVVQVDYRHTVDNDATAYVYDVLYENESRYSVLLTLDGRFLQINGYNLADSAVKENIDYSAVAESFASRLGYDVKTMWVSEEAQGVVYVNMIYVTGEGVKVYPDMVKAAIDASSGEVVSFDAFSYLLNHKNRRMPKNYDAYAFAASKLHPKLSIQNRGRAVIPDECGTEFVCYEFITTRGGDTFYIYIDAKDYTERDILKVVKSEYGNYVM